MKNICVFIFVSGLVCIGQGAKWDGNCLNPPFYDGDCCKEGIFEDDVPTIKTCAQKFSLTLNANNDVIPTVANLESYVCFTDCLYVADKYINNGALDLNFIKTDVAARAKNFTELGTIYYNAMEKCSKSTDKIAETIKPYPNSDKYLKGKCSPTAQLIDDCTDIEYFANCPAKYWTPNVPECDDVKAYAAKCKLLK
ncbi:uncharacterized protein LOC129616042 [Condylostylus longicornis]|uniref:uncharacterized protein LOC129616042 n=1 Tax=Condylostylus longicornis TaxID=2530218 RepID=UPI00244DD5B1|nr:uncharacterized protein LOC129616042 [Condylostylus longicornis]